MGSAILQIVKFIGGILLIVSSPIIVFILIMIIIVLINIIKLKRKGYKRKKDDRKITKNSITDRIFKQLPKQLSLDYMNHDPYDFKEDGLHMYCGRQGCGKTIAVTEMLIRMKEIYPKVKIRTNMNYKYEDASLEHWKQMVDNVNGKYGQIEVLDEIQNWFNSNDSRNFPYEMLTEISQQRKQRKMLVGTAQVYSRIAKPIREQVTVVYLPRTYLGCITIVKKTRPEFWNNDKMKFTEFEGRYFFVHNEKLRSAYDTYQKIKRYSRIGFQQRTEQNDVIVNVASN